MRKRKDKEDSNSPGIVARLAIHGYEVTKTERPVDLHIYDPKTDRGGWAEVKVEGENVLVKWHQLEFLSDARQPTTIVRNEGEALIFASNFEGWSDEQKDRIASLLIRNPEAKAFKMRLIEKTLGTNSTSQ